MPTEFKTAIRALLEIRSVLMAEKGVYISHEQSSNPVK